MKNIKEDGGAVTAGGGAIAGIGVASSDPSAPANFKEPGVPRKRKKKEVVMTNDPLSRKSLMKFREWIEEESKHDVRGVTGKMMQIKKQPVRHPGGKMTMEYPGKSSSSGGGD